jgi:hypothetical protein
MSLNYEPQLRESRFILIILLMSKKIPSLGVDGFLSDFLKSMFSTIQMVRINVYFYLILIPTFFLFLFYFKIMSDLIIYMISRKQVDYLLFLINNLSIYNIPNFRRTVNGNTDKLNYLKLVKI